MPLRKSVWRTGLTLLKVLCDVAAAWLSYNVGLLLWLKLSAAPAGAAVPDGERSALFCLFAVLLYFYLGLYSKERSLMNVRETEGILRAGLIVFVLVLAFPVSGNCLALNLQLAALVSVCLVVVTTLGRYAMFKLEQNLHRAGLTSTRVLFWGLNDAGRRLAAKLRGSPKFGYEVIGCVLPGEAMDAMAEASDVPVLGSTDDVVRVVKDHGIEELFLADPWVAGQDVARAARRVWELARELRRLGARVRVIPNLENVTFRQLQHSEILGLSVLRVHNPHQSLAGRFAKRLVDGVVALVAIVVLSPLFLILTTLIKRDSSGPAFFVQWRAGRNGKLFRMYKFRTMYESAPKYALTPEQQGDPRVTSLGAWLRRTSLDELPQLFNVLKGDMSLVGPRPEMPFVVEKYSDLERLRLLVRPGITGLWQISADRSRQIHENVEHDLYYVENQSLLLDLAIMIRTVVPVIHGVGAV